MNFQPSIKLAGTYFHVFLVLNNALVTQMTLLSPLVLIYSSVPLHALFLLIGIPNHFHPTNAICPFRGTADVSSLVYPSWL